MKTTLLPLAALILSARALADPVTLEWDRNPEPDVVEYRVYLSDEKGVYGAPAQTLDGSRPIPRNPSANLILAPFSATAGQTLRAQAFLAGYTASPETRTTLA